MTRYYPKHLRRRQQREQERIIAQAVLAGFVAIKHKHRYAGLMPDGRPYYRAAVWEVRWPDGKVGHFYGRTIPALMFLCTELHGASWAEAWEMARRREGLR